MVKEIQSSHTQYKPIVMNANDSVLSNGCFLELIRIFWRKKYTRGPRAFPRDRGRPPYRARPPISWAPWTSTDLNSNSIYSRSGRKKIREKVSSRFTTRSRRQALISLGRADLESVRGSGEGDSSPSSSSTILHHQFHDAHRRA